MHHPSMITHHSPLIALITHEKKNLDQFVNLFEKRQKEKRKKISKISKELAMNTLFFLICLKF